MTDQAKQARSAFAARLLTAFRHLRFPRVRKLATAIGRDAERHGSAISVRRDLADVVDLLARASHDLEHGWTAAAYDSVVRAAGMLERALADDARLEIQ